MENLVGQKFNMLLVVEPVKLKCGRNGYKCLCDCGNYTELRPDVIMKGSVKSCGCLRLKKIHECMRTHGEAGGAIEGKRTGLYRRWANIKSRCYNEKVRSYKDYGAKGVKLCDEWHDFKVFAEWAYSHGYREDLVIDRIDSNGDYCPENCRWITAAENSKRAFQKHCWGKNLKTDEYVEFWCIRDFAKERGLSFSCIDRVLHGRNKTHKNWIFGYLE